MTIRQILGAGVASLLASTAFAQEVTLTAPGADEDLTTLLRDASLSLTLTNNETDNAPQDYVAAAPSWSMQPLKSPGPSRATPTASTLPSRICWKMRRDQVAD